MELVILVVFDSRMQCICMLVSFTLGNLYCFDTVLFSFGALRWYLYSMICKAFCKSIKSVARIKQLTLTISIDCRAIQSQWCSSPPREPGLCYRDIHEGWYFWRRCCEVWWQILRQGEKEEDQEDRGRIFWDRERGNSLVVINSNCYILQLYP